MTIELVSLNENIVFSKSDVVVNPVNCKGAMGKGIAAAFKSVFPEMFIEYSSDCKYTHSKYSPGHIVIYDIPEPKPVDVYAKKIINIATKDHWVDPSTYEWIFSGINFMYLFMLSNLHNQNIQSITIPPIGCGYGGLEWNVVKKRLITVFDKLPSNMLVRILSPQ